MFNLFKPKIVFETTIPGLETVMPIIRAKEFKHAWVQRALNELANIRKQPNYGMETLAHTARCPGIFKLQRHGWILRTWQDITIETNGDGENFRWTTPIDQKVINGIDYVGNHPKHQLYNYMENWPKDTLSNVLKIHSGWNCVVPKGYYLMELPVAYLDDNRYTTVTGFFEREQGPAGLNVQMLWHVMNGKELIKAGTPIAQYILVEKDQMDMTMDVIGKKPSTHDIFKLLQYNRYVKSYSEMKRIFKDYK
jgi:hypothetical protein